MRLTKQNCTKNTIIFHHIPKAAGSTFRLILSRQFKSEFIYNLQTLRKHEMIKKFSTINKEKRYCYKLVMGHQAGKLYNLVNNPVIITMLRSPVERVDSLYRHAKRHEDHPCHKIAKLYSLKECFENNIHKEWKELSNGQFDSLCFLFKTNLNVNLEGIIEIDLINKIMDEYIIFGLVERFDESLLLMNKYMGFNHNIYYYRKNTSHDKFKIDPSVIKIIREYNRLDIQLYEYCKNIFNNRLVSELSFLKNKLFLYKTLNMLMYFPAKINDYITFKRQYPKLNA